MNETLNELATKYGTDKGKKFHNYMPIYEKYFTQIRYDVKKILEIGIKQGRSHFMWLNYFPNATVYGIDIDDKTGLEKDRFITFKCDQSDIESLNKFIELYGNDFDIIIDDGGHTMKQQQTSFKILFDALKSGGLYVIEDLFTSYKMLKCYGKDTIVMGEKTTMELFQSIEAEDNKILETDNITKEELEKLKSKMWSCIIEEGNISEIVFIRRR